MKPEKTTEKYWLVKQEPESYAWKSFVKDGSTAWTGVRNYQARNNLRSMEVEELVLYYHSGDEKQVVGIARVQKKGYADPTAKEGDWSAVDLIPIQPLERPVTLQEIKKEPSLKNIALIRNSRLSVIPLTKAEFETILKMGKTKI